jgi:hypothetical protein
MLKKLSIITIMIFMYLPVLISQDSIASRIVIYREPNYVGAALSYKVFVNDQMIVKIRNNTYYEYFCAPGEYVVHLGQSKNKQIKIDLQEGETYFIKIGMTMNLFAVVPEPIPVDAEWATTSISRTNMKKIEDNNNAFLERPKNRFGFNFGFGAGLKQIPMVILTTGDKSNISFGGGIVFGLKYGYEVGKYFDLAAELNYQFTQLAPVIENGEVSFTRGNFSITPSLIIPIDGGYSMRLKLGAGLNYNFSPVLDVDLNQMTGGFNDTWKYNDALGYHISLVWERNYSESFSANIGLKYVDVQYEFESSLSGQNPDMEFLRGNGKDIEILMGVYYHF